MSVVFALPVSASTTNGTIDATNKYAWGENIGWINFGTTNGNVHITDSGMTGYALSETSGWINLEDVVNDGEGNLSGYGWGENIGWVNFDPVNGGVAINSSGEFMGSALSETAGWIIFGGDYKVKTDWRAQTLRPACNNTLDDDGDGLIDYPSDSGCSDLNDDNEVNGVAFVAPPKPSIQNISIALDGNKLEFKNLPANIIQIAISLTPDFNNSSWEDVAKREEILNRYSNTKRFYIKLRTDRGAVSDVMIYEPSSSVSSLNDGDIVKTINNPDVYVIKIKNNKKYKRLILSPSVFKSYGHLKWGNLKIVSQAEMDQYTTSSLVKETKDSVIYELIQSGDQGTKRVYATYINGIPHQVRDDTSVKVDVLDSVYEINAVDRDSYKLAG
jgi:hypothetical protein